MTDELKDVKVLRNENTYLDNIIEKNVDILGGFLYDAMHVDDYILTCELRKKDEIVVELKKEYDKNVLSKDAYNFYIKIYKYIEKDIEKLNIRW